MGILVMPSFSGSKKGVVYCFLQFLFILVGTLVILLSMKLPDLIKMPAIEGEYGVALTILHEHERALRYVTIGCMAGFAIAVLGCIFCLIKIRIGRLAHMALPIYIAVFVILMTGFFCYLAGAEIYREIPKFASDIELLEAGQTSSVTGALSPRIQESSLSRNKTNDNIYTSLVCVYDLKEKVCII